MSSNYIDPRDETVHLERGESFGVSKHLYYFLAQACVSASQIAGIEPQLLEHLANGQPGCVCTLFGSTYCFTVQLEMEPPPPIVTLVKTLLDSSSTLASDPIVAGFADGFAVWREIVCEMLVSEGWTAERLWERGYFPV